MVSGPQSHGQASSCYSEPTWPNRIWGARTLLHNCFCTLCLPKSIVIFSLCSSVAAGSLYSLSFSTARCACHCCFQHGHQHSAVKQWLKPHGATWSAAADAAPSAAVTTAALLHSVTSSTDKHSASTADTGDRAAAVSAVQPYNHLSREFADATRNASKSTRSTHSSPAASNCRKHRKPTKHITVPPTRRASDGQAAGCVPLSHFLLHNVLHWQQLQTDFGVLQTAAL
jgi:hypothetical protein